MTQADSAAPALRRSLDSDPTQGQGQAEITATTPLPPGWSSFCSKPTRTDPAHWYATAPWDADVINLSHGLRGDENQLTQTVDAETWRGLHRVVAEQVLLHQQLSGRAHA
ncbi:hypothetical protein ADK36_13890 [Streptomyces viridochromogenes]|nr:hypothetical protein ADK36_13890 [Streptomyces viridochromogenes]